MVRPSFTQTLLAAASFAALTGAGPALAQATPTPHHPGMHAMTTDAPLLSFSITEELRSTPDRATIGAGVQTQAATAVEAMRLNATQMAAVIAALRARGVPERDIQTSGLSLAAQYDYAPQQNGQPPRFTGYQVSNTVRVTTANIARLGELLDALVTSGATNLDGPNFFVAEPDALLDTAREAALRRASDRAARYARAAGYANARLISVTEGGGFTPPPMPMMARMEAAADASTPIQPGQVTNGITLSVQYRLER